VQELFHSNLPARTIVDSDFTFLNERLAKHYGIPGVTGVAMRKVALPKDSVRGGIMTQASVLKVTANGTTTSPVLRGVWIIERILGIRMSQPAGVPAIEPDIRGAVTIRQQLDRHRADPTCASCHRTIDPPGFALESFDVMGGWRDRYRAYDEKVKPAPGIGLSGQPFAFHHGLPVDSAGQAFGWTDVCQHPRVQEAPARSRRANGSAKPRRPAHHLRHRRAYCVLGSQTVRGSARQSSRLGLRCSRHRTRDC
jgi:hypothetical protein